MSDVTTIEDRLREAVALMAKLGLTRGQMRRQLESQGFGIADIEQELTRVQTDLGEDEDRNDPDPYRARTPTRKPLRLVAERGSGAPGEVGRAADFGDADRTASAFLGALSLVGSGAWIIAGPVGAGASAFAWFGILFGTFGIAAATAPGPSGRRVGSSESDRVEIADGRLFVESQNGSSACTLGDVTTLGFRGSDALHLFDAQGTAVAVVPIAFAENGQFCVRLAEELDLPADGKHPWLAEADRLFAHEAGHLVRVDGEVRADARDVVELGLRPSGSQFQGRDTVLRVRSQDGEVRAFHLDATTAFRFAHAVHAYGRERVEWVAPPDDAVVG